MQYFFYRNVLRRKKSLARNTNVQIFLRVGFCFFLYRIICHTDEQKLQSFKPKWSEGEANGRTKEQSLVYWVFWLGYKSTSACPNQIQNTEVTQHHSLAVDVCHHSVIVLRHLCSWERIGSVAWLVKPLLSPVDWCSSIVLESKPGRGLPCEHSSLIMEIHMRTPLQLWVYTIKW